VLRRPIRWLAGKLVRGRATLGTAVRGVVVNRLRAFLSSLGICIGVATLIAIWSMVQGLQQSFARQLASLGANTIYVTARPWIIQGDWWRYRNRPPITLKDVEALRRGGSVLHAVAPVSFAMSDVSHQSERMELVQVRGTTSEYLDTSNLIVENGRFLTPIEVELDEAVVVIGSEVAKQLFRGADPLGQRIIVGSGRFRVVGTLAEQGKMFGQSLDTQVLIPLGRFRAIYGIKRNLAIAVTADPARLHAAEEQIIEVLRRSRGLSSEKAENFAMNRQEAIVKLFRSQTDTLFMVAIVVGIITLVVGGIGVMNIMLVAVTERTREIGVRRALGARRGTILAQFLSESMMVTIIGGAFGTALGMAGAQLVALVSPLPASANIATALVGVVFSGLVGLVFGTWPAYRASVLDPIESLRYE
jgi:putative ABC transport system permease protein